MRSNILTKELMDLVQQFNDWRYEQRMIFLDLVDPQVEEPAPAKTAKKKRVRAAGNKSARATGLAATLNKNLAQQRKPMCAVCGSTDPRDGDHGTGAGQHEFDANVSGRLQKLMSDGPQCAFTTDGKTCHGLAGDAIHDPAMGYLNHHEFVASAVSTAGGGS